LTANTEIASASAIKISTEKGWIEFSFNDVDVSHLPVVYIGIFLAQGDGSMSFSGGSGDSDFVYIDGDGKNCGYQKTDNSNGNFGATTNSCPALEIYKASMELSVSSISVMSPLKIYAYQDSDDFSKTPPVAVYLDSVLTQKQKVAFSNGLDRTYMMPNNQEAQTDDVNISTISETLKGAGYHELNMSFAMISIKTSVVADKTARLLVLGDSVTAGYNADVNNDNRQPNTYWGVAAELAFAKFDSFEMIGDFSSDKANILGSLTTIKAEGRGGWKLLDFLFSETINDVMNPFYDVSKTWTDEDLSDAEVKFSLTKY